ncbi:hypothetical protein [Pseudomonas parafulva]|uniref:hypothetical protein n=1 Tax=Pseudomonas parafulva TaxID=157782 RepID=UPI000429CB49|nr:hypothetical protein [Pseudomonas parafulva]
MPQVQPVAPLTIIAIFAGIIEASALATLPFLSEASQKLYTWFLVGFPFFLTALFFLTLNFNYKSFYSPALPRAVSADGAPTRDTDSKTAALNNEPINAEQVTFMFSGPDACQLLEKQLLLTLAEPAEPARTWQFCNLQTCQRIRLSISPMNTPSPAVAS